MLKKILGILFITMEAFAMSPPDLLVGNIQCQGSIGLNMTQAVNQRQLMLCVLNSNSTTGFDVTFIFQNSAKFTTSGREIEMTELLLDHVTGTIGTGLTKPVDIDMLTVMAGSDSFFWDPGSVASTETTNYIFEVKGSWDDPSNELAGFYTEYIQVVMTVGL